jgi:hypothetical protein
VNLRTFEHCDVPPPQPAGKSPFHIKGQFYIQAMRALDRSRADRARMPTDLRDFCAQRFLASSWYDALPLVRIAMFEADHRGQDVRELTREQAERAAEHGLRGVYKLFVPLFMPQTVVMRTLGARMVAAIGQFYDFAPAKVIEPSDSHTLTIERADVPLCMLEWWSINATHYALTALKIAGVKDVRGEYAYSAGDSGLGRVVISIRRAKR